MSGVGLCRKPFASSIGSAKPICSSSKRDSAIPTISPVSARKPAPLSPGTIGRRHLERAFATDDSRPVSSEVAKPRSRRRNRPEPDSRARRLRGRSDAQVARAAADAAREVRRERAHQRARRDLFLAITVARRISAVADRHVQIPGAVDRVLHRENVAAPSSARDHDPVAYASSKRSFLFSGGMRIVSNTTDGRRRRDDR